MKNIERILLSIDFDQKMSTEEKLDKYIDTFCYDCEMNDCDFVGDCSCWLHSSFIFNEKENKRYRLEDFSGRVFAFFPYDLGLNKKDVFKYIESLRDSFEDFLIAEIYE